MTWWWRAGCTSRLLEGRRNGTAKFISVPIILRRSDMADKGFTVTEATEGHVEAIAEFFWTAWKEAGPTAPGWAGATDEALKELTARDNLLKRLGRPDRRLFLAWQGGKVIGFSANRRVDSDMVELAGLVVLQGSWGQGVGSRLLDAAVSAAGQGGYKQMRARTEASNERAIKFYESRGFQYIETLVEKVGETEVEGWKLVRDL